VYPFAVVGREIEPVPSGTAGTYRVSPLYGSPPRRLNHFGWAGQRLDAGV